MYNAIHQTGCIIPKINQCIYASKNFIAHVLRCNIPLCSSVWNNWHIGYSETYYPYHVFWFYLFKHDYNKLCTKDSCNLCVEKVVVQFKLLVIEMQSINCVIHELYYFQMVKTLGGLQTHMQDIIISYDHSCTRNSQLIYDYR
jgi:hypothetical protein